MALVGVPIAFGGAGYGSEGGHLLVMGASLILNGVGFAIIGPFIDKSG